MRFSLLRSALLFSAFLWGGGVLAQEATEGPNTCTFASPAWKTCGFAVPADAEIIGIEVTIHCHAPGSSSPTQIALTFNGTSAATSYLPSPGLQCPFRVLDGDPVYNYRVFGSPVDTWGLDPADLTPAVVNAATFGALVNGAADTDEVTITITYSDFAAGTTTLEGGRAFIGGAMDATRADATRPFKIQEPPTCKATMGEFAVTTGVPATVLQCGPTDTWSAIFAGAVPTVTVGIEQGLVVTRDEAGRVLYADATDAGEAVQAGIDRLETLTHGTLIWKPGAYTYNATVPKLPPNLTDWIKVQCMEGVTVTGNASAPGLVSVRKDADFDVYRYHWIDGCTFDQNGVTPASGSYASLYGNLQEYPTTTAGTENRVNFERIRVTNNTVLNNTTIGVSMQTLRNDASDTTAMYARDIVVDGNTILGGPYGIRITAGNVTGDGSTIDAEYDQIAVRKNTIVASGSVLANNIFIGSNAHGGHAEVTDNTVSMAYDSGIEVNGFTSAEISGNVILNPRLSGILAVNFGTMVDPSKQVYRIRGNRVEWDTSTGSSPVAIASFVGGTRQSFGMIEVDGLQVAAKGITSHTMGNVVEIVGAHEAGFGSRGIRAQNITISQDNDWNSTATHFWNLFRLDSDSVDWAGDGTADPPLYDFNGIDATLAIRKGAGSGAFNVRGFFAQGPMRMSIRNWTMKGAMTGSNTTGTFYGMFIGQETVTPATIDVHDSDFSIASGWTSNPATFWESGGLISDGSKITIDGLDTTGTHGGSDQTVDFDFQNKPTVAQMVRVRNSRLRQREDEMNGSEASRSGTQSIADAITMPDQYVCTTGGKLGWRCTPNRCIGGSNDNTACTVGGSECTGGGVCTDSFTCGSSGQDRTCAAPGVDIALRNNPRLNRVDIYRTSEAVCAGGSNSGNPCTFSNECPSSYCTDPNAMSMTPETKTWQSILTSNAEGPAFSSYRTADAGWTGDDAHIRSADERTTGDVCWELARKRVCSGGSNPGTTCRSNETCTGGGTCAAADSSMDLCLTPGGTLRIKGDSGTVLATFYQGGGTNANRTVLELEGPAQIDELPADTSPSSTSDQLANAWGWRAGTNTTGRLHIQGTDDAQNRSSIMQGAYVTRTDSVTNRQFRASGTSGVARGIDMMQGNGQSNGVFFYTGNAAATQHALVNPFARVSIDNGGYTRWWNRGTTSATVGSGANIGWGTAAGTCVAGSNAGNICYANADCPSSTCTGQLAATTLYWWPNTAPTVANSCFVADPVASQIDGSTVSITRWLAPAACAAAFGSSLSINGAGAATNLSDTTPTAPTDATTGGENVLWQASGANASAYVKTALVKLRNPTDTVYTDGLNQWTGGTTTLMDAVDDLNEELSALAPVQPLSMTAAAVTFEICPDASAGPTCASSSSRASTVRASAGGSFYKSAAGENFSTYTGGGLVLNDNFTVRPPEAGSADGGTPADDAFSNGREGTLTARIQKSGVEAQDGSIDLTSTGCTGTCTAPTGSCPATNGALILNAQCTYNSFSAWQRGDVTMNPDASGALGDGYNKMYFRHNVGSNRDSGNFDVFLDTVATNPTFVTGKSCALANTSASTKFLSGVKFYSAGSTFCVAAGVQDCFNNAYQTDAFQYSPLTGGASTWFTSQAVGVDTPSASWNSTVSNPPARTNTPTLSGGTVSAGSCDGTADETFSALANKALSNARATCSIRKPLRTTATSNSGSATNDTASRLLQTWGTTEGLVGSEPFLDENRRLCGPSSNLTCCGSGAAFNFDSTSATMTGGGTGSASGTWISNCNLGTGTGSDAEIYVADTTDRGALIYPAANFATGFNPATGACAGAQCDYSGHTGDHFEYRGFSHAGTGKSNAVIRLYGVTSADLVPESSTTENKIKVSFRLPGLTQWADAVAAFNAGDPTPLQTDGEGAADEPMRSSSGSTTNCHSTCGGASSVDLPVTFAGFSTASSGNRIYVRVSFEDTSAPRPTQAITCLELHDKSGTGNTNAVCWN